MDMMTKTKNTAKKAMDRPMRVVGKKYASVSALVRDTAEAEVANQFDKYQTDRRLINCLTVVRCANEVTQVELAKRMDCAQSKVSKMESSTDADLNFGDIISYARALKQSVSITFAPARKHGADRIRFLIECIKHELDKLVKIAGDDKTIGDDVEAYAIETVQNMVKLIEESLDRLPHRMQQSNAPVSIEVECDRGQRLPLNGPKRVHKSAKKTAPVA
jgi:uncharacterized protein with PIN domain